MQKYLGIVQVQGKCHHLSGDKFSLSGAAVT